MTYNSKNSKKLNNKLNYVFKSVGRLTTPSVLGGGEESNRKEANENKAKTTPTPSKFSKSLRIENEERFLELIHDLLLLPFLHSITVSLKKDL